MLQRRAVMGRVVIFLADGFEEVEAVTPVDYLRRSGIEVVLAGVNTLTPTGARGIRLHADIEVGEIDWLPEGLILPGGLPGAENLADSEDVDRLCSEVMKAGGLLASICAAPALVLGSYSLLEGRRFTCYPGFETKVAGGVFSERSVVVDGNIITSRGAGTAGEFSLAVIEYLRGREAADRIAEAVLLQSN